MNEQAVLRRQLARGEVEKFFAQLAPTAIALANKMARIVWAMIPHRLGHDGEWRDLPAPTKA